MDQIIIQRLDNLLSRDTTMTMKGFSEQRVLAFSAIFVCLGLGFILYGVYLWLVENYSQPIAAMVSGVICLVIAGLSIVGIGWAIQYRQKKIKMIVPEIIELVHETIDSLNAEFGEPIRANPKTAVLVASLVGYVFKEKFY